MQSPPLRVLVRRGVYASANPLFESAASAFGADVIPVVLSGGGMDATDGVQSIKRAGGTVIVQGRATSRIFGMGDLSGRARRRERARHQGRVSSDSM